MGYLDYIAQDDPPIFLDTFFALPVRLAPGIGRTVYEECVDNRPLIELVELLEARLHNDFTDAEKYAARAVISAEMRAEMKLAFPWLQLEV